MHHTNDVIYSNVRPYMYASLRVVGPGPRTSLMLRGNISTSFSYHYSAHSGSHRHTNGCGVLVRSLHVNVCQDGKVIKTSLMPLFNIDNDLCEHL